MKMENKSISAILEGQEVLLNSVISSLDLRETSSRTVRPLLEYLRQDIKGHLRDLQEASSTTPTQEDSESVEMQRLKDIILDMNHRISKLEEKVYPKRSIFQERP